MNELVARSAAEQRALLGRVRTAALVAVGTTGYAAVLVFLRGRPSLKWDAGIFVSVAARLLSGDRLYSGVWDDKPPFFYYGDAVAMKVFGWRGPFLLDVFWLALAAWSLWFLLRAVGTSRLTAAVGYVAYPLFLTGTWYLTGYSELPVMALAPLVAALWVRRMPAGAGAVLGVALFYRPAYALIALALLVAATPRLYRAGPLPSRRDFVRLLVGVGSVVALAFAVLAARGELSGFVHAMVGNLGYPNRYLRLDLRLPTGLTGHIDAIGHFLRTSALPYDRKLLFAILLAALLALIASAILMLRRARSSARLDSQATVAGLLVAAAVAALVTSLVAAPSRHGLESLALPLTLLTVFWASTLENAVGWVPARVAVISVVVLGAVVGLGGRGAPGSVGPLSEWWRPPTSTAAAALNLARSRLYGGRSSVTYADLGRNDEEGAAAFLQPGFELACPQFAQYEFSGKSYLEDTLTCLRRRRPDLVLVTPSFEPLPPYDADWNAFVRSATSFLQRHYHQTLTMSEAGRIYAVWRPRNLS